MSTPYVLSAEAAKNLAELCDANLDKILTKIFFLIKGAAENGKRTINSFEMHSIDEMKLCKNRMDGCGYSAPMFSPFQFRIKKSLENLGYHVSIVLIDVQVGGGLGSDKEKEPEIKATPVIQIMW